jgi:hypothetical protein
MLIFNIIWLLLNVILIISNVEPNKIGKTIIMLIWAFYFIYNI